jgi:site-specific DNA recombinase
MLSAAWVLVCPPPSQTPRKYWTRRGIAEWLVKRLAEDAPTLVGTLAIPACLGYTKQYDENTEAKPPDQARPQAGGDLRPRLLQGAGEGGLSIPAQLKLLKEYAVAQGFAVAREYVDVETGKQTGRAAFGEMVADLKGHPAIRVVLVEKTDRLYRNLKDWVTVDELEVEIHFPKEGVVLSRESRFSEKFMHGIKVLMAKNYVDNLSEETRKGMLEKAEQGIWPSFAPLGYRNIDGPDGKKIITPDPDVAPIVSKLFEWYAMGQLSLKEVAKKAQDAGLVYRKSGGKVPVSTIHSILRNRLYTGRLEWNGKMFVGRHEPLVSVKLWERVQGILDGRFAKKHRRMTHDFAFSGLIACSKCGCSVIGEMKKQRYVYYHCTGYADKCQGNPASCRRRYVREELLESQFTALLGRLKFDDEVLAWVREALHASHADKRQEQ